MFESFRHTMSWVHTWFGLALGFVLMVVFFFGSLAVFDREIDRWAIPQTRFEPRPMPSFDHTLAPLFASITPDPRELDEAHKRVGARDLPLRIVNWSAYATHRDPVISLYAEFSVDHPGGPHEHLHGHVTIDPRSGRALPDGALKIGSAFFFPLHYSLHLQWRDVGCFIVGMAALVMLAALLSGVVIHRRWLQELFTFRPHKAGRRSTLDLHNLTGVLALPFHSLLPLTGLIIFCRLYFPFVETVLSPLAERAAQVEAATQGLALAPAGEPATLASVDAMVIEAKRRWAARSMPGEVGVLSIEHVGDANSNVSVQRAGTDRVALVGQAVHFAGPSGEVLYEEPPPAWVSSVEDYLVGLHMLQFRHWLLRWLYVLGGLCGCVCIGTGLVLFVGKRKRRHARQGRGGARWVDALAATSTTGMLLATFALLAANRALPEQLAQRDVWQLRVFWGAWLAAFVHAAWRSGPTLGARIAPGWREQCWAVAVLALSAALLNWVTTGDHLIRTLSRLYWPVAGVDLALLATAACAACAALHLGRRERAYPRGTSCEDETHLPTSAEASHV